MSGVKELVKAMNSELFFDDDGDFWSHGVVSSHYIDMLIKIERSLVDLVYQVSEQAHEPGETKTVEWAKVLSFQFGSITDLSED